MTREDRLVSTPGRGLIELTQDLQQAVARSGVQVGLCLAFVHHTSASLILGENADPLVQVDLESVLARLCPDGDPVYRHTEEGPDDMSAHLRSVLTASSLTIPVRNGRADLGTWQGLFLWEHRTAPHERTISFTVW